MGRWLCAAQATDARDGLVKNIYSKMFDWIVSMINTNIRPGEHHSMFIGVLDIFGFEVRTAGRVLYPRAGLKQAVCVSVCSTSSSTASSSCASTTPTRHCSSSSTSSCSSWVRSLRWCWFAFVTRIADWHTFNCAAEQAEYTRENIEWKSIVFEDNKDCLELIEGRTPPGILALIDEQCLVKVRG